MAGDKARARNGFAKVMALAPDGYWARRSIEVWADPSDGDDSSPDLLALYEVHKETDIGGHLLFHAVLELTASGEMDAPRLSTALYLLVLLVDHHSVSPLWDDGLWLAADLLHASGRHGDEARLLEEALLPHPGRGIDSLHSQFVQKVRYRLALLYRRQGRREEALYQLGLVLSSHDSLRLKDDALWHIAHICAVEGKEAGEEKALRTLLECCPWSRYADRVRGRLEAR